VTTPSGIGSWARLLTDPPGYVQGWQEIVYGPDPAAGASYSHQVDGRWSERVILAEALFTASAAVANRDVLFTVANADGLILSRGTAVRSAAAGNVVGISGQQGMPYDISAVSGWAVGPLPRLLMPPGWFFRLDIINVQAGDTLTGVRLVVQRFPSDITRIDAEG
jgi:hypothetical protein